MKTIRGKTSTVVIDGDVVYKKFNEKVKKPHIRTSSYHCYLRELECLKRLQEHKNFPKLLEYDDEELIIKMDYCGEHYPVDGTSRPELLEQVYEIVYKLEEENIKFITIEFPYQNILIKNNVLKMIDFEHCLPENSDVVKYCEDNFIEDRRGAGFNIQKFEDEFKVLVLKGVELGKVNYETTLQEANEMIRNDWDNYQKVGKGNSAEWRINQIKLDRFSGKDKTLLDLGANHGEFGLVLSKDYERVVALEPFVKAPENMPENMKWIAKGFKDYTKTNTEQFDVVFSFAMTIQVQSVDGLKPTDIAQGHYDLVKDGGTMIYETQKVAGRPENQKHVDNMLVAFQGKFGKWIEEGEGRSSGARRYYVFKK